MGAPNLVLVSDLQTLVRRDFSLADSSLLQPLASNPLVDGEWLALDSAYKLARDAGESASPLLFPVFAERGRYDTQAIGKVPVLMFGMFEATSLIVDTTGLALGDALTIQDVTISGQVKRGLKKKSGATKCVVGYVSKLLGSGKTQFVHYGNVVI